MQANISYGYMTMWFVGFWSGSVEEMWKNWELQTTEAPESASELWWKLEGQSAERNVNSEFWAHNVLERSKALLGK